MKKKSPWDGRHGNRYFMKIKCRRTPYSKPKADLLHRIRHPLDKAYLKVLLALSGLKLPREPNRSLTGYLYIRRALRTCMQICEP